MASAKKWTSIAPLNRCRARDLYDPSDGLTDIGKLSLLQFHSPSALHHNVARIIVPKCRIHHRDRTAPFGSPFIGFVRKFLSAGLARRQRRTTLGEGGNRTSRLAYCELRGAQAVLLVM